MLLAFLPIAANAAVLQLGVNNQGSTANWAACAGSAPQQGLVEVAQVRLVRPSPNEFFSALKSQWKIELDVETPGSIHIELIAPGAPGMNRILGIGDFQTTSTGRQQFSINKQISLDLAAMPGEIDIYGNHKLLGSRKIGITLFAVGQSNSANWGCARCIVAPNISAGQRIFIFNDTTVPPMPSLQESISTNTTPRYPLPALGVGQWSPLASWPHSYLPIANGRRTSLWPSVADQMASQYPKLNFALASVGVGSTSVAQWADGNYLYQRFGYLLQIWDADLILWVQGESDAESEITSADYQYTLNYLRNSIPRDFPTGSKSDLKWMLFITTGGSLGCAEIAASGHSKIRQSVQNLVSQFPSAFALGPNLDSIPHACHFDSDSEFHSAVDLISSTLLNYFEKRITDR
jgi:Carbohydrate esterase, sialic acid-specific acetylesterase